MNIGLERLLRCLQSSTYPKSLIEIVVVDNGSKKAPRLSESGLNARVIYEPKPGSYAARNSGVRHTRGDILVFTDADCLPSEAWISSGVACLLGGADRVAGPIEVLTKETAPGPSDLYQRAFSFDVWADMREKGQVATANFFVWRNTFERVGEFNESAFSGADKEWGRRAESMGVITVFCPQASIGHEARRFKQLVQQRKRIAGGVVLGAKSVGLATSLQSEFLRTRLGALRRLFAFDESISKKVLAIGVGAWLLVVQAWWSLIFLVGRNLLPPRA